MKSFALLLLTTLIFSTFAQAQQTNYIRDELYVPIRSGQSSEHRILQMGVSGTALKVLRTNEETGYSLVRTKDGAEGWVQTQYLQDTPIAATLLERANRELEQLRQQTEELKNQLSNTRSDRKEATTELTDVTAERDQLRAELESIKAVSANAIQLDQDNRELLQTNQVLRNRADVLETENQQLRDSRENDAFLNGAFAVLIGVGITLLVPRLWPKRKSEWA